MLAESVGRVYEDGASDNVSKIDVRRWADMLAGVFKRVRECGWPEMYRERLIRPLTGGLRDQSPVPDALLEVIIEALCELQKTSPDFPELGHSASQELSDLIESGDVSRQLGDLSERSPSLIAWGAFAILREQVSINNLDRPRPEDPAAASFLRSLTEHFAASPTRDSEWRQTRAEMFVDQFLSTLARYSQENLLFDMLRAGEGAAAPLVAQCLLRAVEGERLRLDPRQVLQHWPALQESFGGGDFVNFLEKVLARTDLLRLVLRDGFDAARVRVYEYLYVASTGNKEFRNWLLEGLSGLAYGEREWAEQLRTNGDILNLATLLSLTTLGTRGVDEEPYARALAEYAGDICQGAKPAALRSDLPAVLPEGGPARRGLRSTLFRMLRKRAGDVPPAFHEMFATEIINPEVVVEHQAGVPELLRDFLRHEGGGPWLDTFAQAFRANTESLLSSLDPVVLKELAEVVIGARRGGDERDAVGALFKILKLYSQDAIVLDYETLLRHWVNRALETTLDVKAELKKMRDSGEPFTPNYSPPYTLLERRRAALKTLGEVKVQDEAALRAKLIKVLDKIIAELEHGKFIPPADAEPPAGAAKGGDADYDVQP